VGCATLLHPCCCDLLERSEHPHKIPAAERKGRLRLAWDRKGCMRCAANWHAVNMSVKADVMPSGAAALRGANSRQGVE
jgi:hypothetical protein